MSDPPAFKADTPAEIVCDWLLEQSPLPTLELAVEWYAQNRLPQRAMLLFMHRAYNDDYQRWELQASEWLKQSPHGIAMLSFPGWDSLTKPTVLKPLDFLTIRREYTFPEGRHLGELMSSVLAPLGFLVPTAERLSAWEERPIYSSHDKERHLFHFWQELKPIDLLPPEYGPSPLTATAYRTWRVGQAMQAAAERRLTP